MHVNQESESGIEYCGYEDWSTAKEMKRSSGVWFCASSSMGLLLLCASVYFCMELALFRYELVPAAVRVAFGRSSLSADISLETLMHPQLTAFRVSYGCLHCSCSIADLFVCAVIPL